MVRTNEGFRTRGEPRRRRKEDPPAVQRGEPAGAVKEGPERSSYRRQGSPALSLCAPRIASLDKRPIRDWLGTNERFIESRNRCLQSTGGAAPKAITLGDHYVLSCVSHPATQDKFSGNSAVTTCSSS